MNSVKMDVYETFHRSWALLTAGNEGDFNTMTVSWGGLGCLWNKPVATVYVRPSRFTYEFMEKQDYFTLSFYPEEYKPALGLLGRESGRDGDKVVKSGLTPVPFRQGVTFAEAKTTLLCKKLYWQDMEADRFPQDVKEKFFGPGETVHRLYIGEILEVQTGE